MEHIVDSQTLIYIHTKGNISEPSIIPQRGFVLLDYYVGSVETLYEDQVPKLRRINFSSRYNTFHLGGGGEPISWVDSIAWVLVHTGETRLSCKLLAVENRQTCYLTTHFGFLSS